ncbi:glycosyl hydrolase 108 family protein [Hymenobacter cavernae]|uniref:TtsA-like Glycoside hydrolase family 108 domain-containing protein n=1 Tax=Hymenobacter cavernae TaxID=2044852 RepID=A0ABQ1UVP2_9BACT|nr:glycosyl hydrolase 108 family protein [Hymenobacter cavernae]GGF26385.1 hypothetical protein GCM10011383_42370 [Hymenobacter cavernae]
MSDFKLFYPKLIANEGGYQANPKDLGNGPRGETYKGIASRYHPAWAGWKIVHAYREQWLAVGKKLQTSKDWLAFSKYLAQSTELEQLVIRFYEAQYWDSLLLDLVANQSVAESLADAGVNAGTGRVGWMIQWILRVSFNKDLALDGKIGPLTLKALNAVDQAQFHACFAQLRRDFYRYRTGQFGSYQQEPRLVALHKFFRDKLHLKTDVSQKVFLRTWLQRVDHMKFSA